VAFDELRGLPPPSTSRITAAHLTSALRTATRRSPLPATKALVRVTLLLRVRFEIEGAGEPFETEIAADDVKVAA